MNTFKNYIKNMEFEKKNFFSFNFIYIYIFYKKVYFFEFILKKKIFFMASFLSTLASFAMPTIIDAGQKLFTSGVSSLTNYV